MKHTTSMYATKDAMIEAMHAEIASLKAQLAEARKDSELLGFFELSERWNMKHVSKLASGEIVVSSALHDYDSTDMSFHDVGISGSGKTLREAIHNAIKVDSVQNKKNRVANTMKKLQP